MRKQSSIRLTGILIFLLISFCLRPSQSVPIFDETLLRPSAGLFTSGVVVPDGSYALFGTGQPDPPALIVKVGLAADGLSPNGSLVMDLDEAFISPFAAVDGLGFAYFAVGSLSPGRLVQIRHSNMTRVQHLDLAGGETGVACGFWRHTDAGGRYVEFDAAVDGPPPPGQISKLYLGLATSPGIVVVVDLTGGRMLRERSLVMRPGFNKLTFAAMTLDTGRWAVFGTAGAPAQAVSIDLGAGASVPLAVVGTVTAATSENQFVSGVLAPLELGAPAYTLLLGTNTDEGHTVRLSLDASTGRLRRTGELTVPDAGFFRSAVGDEDGATVWFASGPSTSTSTSVDLVGRYNLRNIVRRGLLRLPGRGGLTALTRVPPSSPLMAGRPDNEMLAVAGTYSDPGSVHLLNLTAMARIGELTMVGEPAGLQAALYCPPSIEFIARGVIKHAFLSFYPLQPPGDEHPVVCTADSSAYSLYPQAWPAPAGGGASSNSSGAGVVPRPPPAPPKDAFSYVYLATDTAPSTLILYAAASRKRVASMTLDMSDGVPRAMAFNPVTREVVVAFYDEAGTVARIAAGPPMVTTGNVTLRNGPNSEHQYQFNAALIDETGSTLLVGTDNSPGAVLRLDARTLAQAPGGLRILPEGQDSVMTLEWVPPMPGYGVAAQSQVLYVTYTEPLVVGKLWAADLSDVEPSLALNASENNAVSTAVDVVRGRLYIGTEYTPADIIVVEVLPRLRRIGSLGVDTAIGTFPVIPSAFATPFAAYFATDSNVPTLLRVDFNTSQLTSVTLAGDLPVFVCALSLRNATNDRLAVNALLGLPSSSSSSSSSSGLRSLTAALAGPGGIVSAPAPAAGPATSASGLGIDPAVFVSSTSPGKVLLFPDIASSFIPDIPPPVPRGYTAFQIASGIIVLIAIAAALLLLAFLTCAWMLQRRLKKQAAESLRRVVVAEKAIALLAKKQENADARTRRAHGYRRLDLGIDASGDGGGGGDGGKDGGSGGDSDSPSAAESGLNTQLFDLLSATLDVERSDGSGSGGSSKGLGSTSRSTGSVNGGSSAPPRRGSSKGRVAFRPSRTSSSGAAAGFGAGGEDPASGEGGGMGGKRPSLRDAVDAARARMSGAGRVGSTRALASAGASSSGGGGGMAMARLVRRVRSRGGVHDAATASAADAARAAVDSARLVRLTEAVTADMLTEQAASHAAGAGAGAGGDGGGGASTLPPEVLRTFIAATVEAAASVLANPEAARAELARGMRAGSYNEDGELVPVAVQVFESEEGAVPEHAEIASAPSAAPGPQRVRLTQVAGAREMIKQVRSVGGGLKRRAEDTTIEVASAKAHRQKLLKMTQSQLRIATDAPPGAIVSLPSSPALTPFQSTDPSAAGGEASSPAPLYNGRPLRRLGSGGQKAQLLELIVSVAAKRAAVAVAQCEDEATRELVMATLLGEAAGVADDDDLDGLGTDDEGLGGGSGSDGVDGEEDLADGFHDVVEVRESSDLGLLGSTRRLTDGSGAMADPSTPEGAAAAAAAAAARAERRSTKEKLRASIKSVAASQARAARAAASAQKTAGLLSPLAHSDGLRRIVQAALARTGDIAAKEALAALTPKDATAAAAVLAARRIERASSWRAPGEKKRDSSAPARRRRRTRSADRAGGGSKGASKTGGKGGKAPGGTGAAPSPAAAASDAEAPPKRGAFSRLFTRGGSTAPAQGLLTPSGRVARTSGGFAIPLKALRGAGRKSVVTSGPTSVGGAMSMTMTSGLASTKPPAAGGSSGVGVISDASDDGHMDGRPLSLNFKSNPLMQAKGRADGAVGGGSTSTSRGGSRPSSVGVVGTDAGASGEAATAADGVTGAVVNPMRAASSGTASGAAAAGVVEAKAAAGDAGAAATGIAAHSGDSAGADDDDDDDDDYDGEDDGDEEPSGDEGDDAALMSRSERFAREAHEVGRILNSVTWAAAISATKDRLIQRLLRICPCLRCCRCLRERSYARPAHEKVGLAALPNDVRKRLSRANAKESRLAVEAATAAAGAGSAVGGSGGRRSSISPISPAVISDGAHDTRAALAAAVLALCNPGGDGAAGAFQLPLLSSPRRPGSDAGGLGLGHEGSEPSTPGARGRAAVLSAAHRIIAVSRLQRSMGALAADAAARSAANSARGTAALEGDGYSPASAASSGSSAAGPSGFSLGAPAMPGTAALVAAATAVTVFSKRGSVSSSSSATSVGSGARGSVISAGRGTMLPLGGPGQPVTSGIMPRIDHRASVRASVAFAASTGIAGSGGVGGLIGLDAHPAAGSVGGDAGSAGNAGSDAGFRPEPAMHPFHLKQLQRQQHQQQQHLVPGVASVLAATSGGQYGPRSPPAHLMAAGAVPPSQRASIAPARAFIYSLEAGSMGFAPAHVSPATAASGGALYGELGSSGASGLYDTASAGAAATADRFASPGGDFASGSRSPAPPAGGLTPVQGASPAATTGFAAAGSPHAPAGGFGAGAASTASASASGSAKGLAASASVRSSSRRLGSAVSAVRAFKGRRSVDIRGSAVAPAGSVGATAALVDGLRTLDASALHALGNDAPSDADGLVDSDIDGDDAAITDASLRGLASGGDAAGALGVSGISPPESPTLHHHHDAASAAPAQSIAPIASATASPAASSQVPGGHPHHGPGPSLTTAMPQAQQLRAMPVPPPAPAAARNAAIMSTDASWAE